MKNKFFISFLFVFLISLISAFAVSLNDDASAVNNLVCTTSSDYIIRWSVDGISQPQFENYFEIDASYLTKGETWTCSVFERRYDSFNHEFYDVLVESDSTVTINTAPVISAIPDVTLNVNQPFTYNVQASDADNDALIYSVDSFSASVGISIDANGVITWTPSASDAGTQTDVLVQVSDGTAAVSDIFTITVNSIGPDTVPPVITLLGTNPLAIEIGHAYTEFGATALDNVDGDITANIVIDSSAVNTNVIGSYSVTYNVEDSNGNDAIQAIRTVNVFNSSTPVAPTFSTSSCPSGTVNATYNCDINANGVGTLTYSLTSHPANMTISGSTGLITWKPTSTGTFSFTVTVSDAATSLSSSRTYSIKVNAPVVEDEDEETANEDDLFIDSIIFETEEVSQGGEILARVTLENEGDIDFEDLKINMGIDELGIQTSTAKFDLNDGKKTTKEIVLELPETVSEGYYLVKFVVSNDDIRVTKYKEIFISGVNAVTLSATNTEFVVEPSITAYQAPTGKARLNWFAIWFMLFVLIALIILLAYLTRRMLEENKTEAEVKENIITELDKSFY